MSGVSCQFIIYRARRASVLGGAALLALLAGASARAQEQQTQPCSRISRRKIRRRKVQLGLLQWSGACGAAARGNAGACCSRTAGNASAVTPPQAPSAPAAPGNVTLPQINVVTAQHASRRRARSSAQRRRTAGGVLDGAAGDAAEQLNAQSNQLRSGAQQSASPRSARRPTRSATMPSSRCRKAPISRSRKCCCRRPACRRIPRRAARSPHPQRSRQCASPHQRHHDARRRHRLP